MNTPYGENSGYRESGGNQPPAYPSGQQYTSQQGYDPQTYGYPADGSVQTASAGCPPVNGGWAVATVIFFWPLAFVAFARALEVYPLYAQGHYAEAQAASDTVAKLGKISLGIWAVVIVLYFLVLFIALGAAATANG